MNLAFSITPTSFVVNAKRYNEEKAVKLAVNTETAQDLTASFENYKYEITSEITSEISSLELSSSMYCWISSITVNYKNLPKHQVTWSVNGVTTSENYTEHFPITFPDNPAAVNGKVFKGWTTEAITGTTVMEPTYVTNATMSETDVTYYAVFATKTGKKKTEVTDVLTPTITGITGGSYYDFSGKTASSTAVYAGNSAGTDDYIQLRSNSNSGIVSTVSGGILKKVAVVWYKSTQNDRTLDIYGSNTAYETAGQLYNSNTDGENLGEIKKGTSTELIINSSYQFIGLRSINGAMYLSSVSITWEADVDTYSDYCTTVPTTATISLNSACHDTDGMVFGTYSSYSAFVVSEDVVVSEVSISNGILYVEKYQTGDIVPANTGVMVSAPNGGDYIVNLSSEAGTSVLGSENLLLSSGAVGITSDAMGAASPDCKYYRLTMHKGTQIGFWWGTANGAAFDVPAYKAYLAVPKSSGAKSGMWFSEDDVATDIKGVKNVDESEVKAFNLNGQRVNEDHKGIVIVNGKKFINK